MRRKSKLTIQNGSASADRTASGEREIGSEICAKFGERFVAEMSHSPFLLDLMVSGGATVSISVDKRTRTLDSSQQLFKVSAIQTSDLKLQT